MTLHLIIIGLLIAAIVALLLITQQKREQLMLEKGKLESLSIYT